MRPIPATSPAPCTSPSYMPKAASAPISRNGEPGSIEPGDALAGEQLAAPHMALARFRRAALGRRAAARGQFVDQRPPAGDVGLVLLRLRAQPAFQFCHFARFPGFRFVNFRNGAAVLGVNVGPC